MYNKDYILRMIEMIGDLIAGILGLIKNGDLQKAEQTLDDAYYDFLKEDASFFRKIKTEKLTEELIEKHNYTNGHLEILSELFFAEAELLAAKGDKDKAIEYYEKSLLLLDFVLETTKSFSFDKQSKFLLLQNRIAQLKDF